MLQLIINDMHITYPITSHTTCMDAALISQLSRPQVTTDPPPPQKKNPIPVPKDQGEGRRHQT